MNDESKIDENDVEYYAPDLGNAKPLDIHDNSEDVDDFETKLDEKVIFQRVAKELYKYPSSAIRELLVNAIGHGARKANEKYGEDNKAYVDIHLHPHERHLTITDVRGAGMTHSQIKSLMSYVGRSGNMDSKTAGQFGMGYFSHLKIADSCIVETRVREAYEYKGKMVHCMAYLNNRGWQWQKTNTTDEDVDLEEPGTRISLTLNNDIDIYDVIRTIKAVAQYQDIMVELTLDDDYGKMSAGKVEIPQTADLADIHEERDDQEVIILDDEEVYFKAVMYKGNYGNMARDAPKVILLARVPIEVDDGMIPNFSGYILNIKDERKYMPLPDRERLAQKSEQALKAKLETLFKDHFGKLTATTAEELEAMPYKMPVLYMNQLNIARFFTQATKDFIHSVQDHTITHIKYDEDKHLTEYTAQHNMHQVLSYRKNAFIVNNKALPPIRAVHEYCIAQGLGTPKFVRIDKKTGVVAKQLLEQWKVPLIREFMKANKIKSVGASGSKASAGLTFHKHTGYGRDTEKITDFEDIEYSNTIFVKGPLKPWMDVMSRAKTDFFVTKYNKKAVEYGIENDESIITEATLYGMKDFEVVSSKGKQMFSEWHEQIHKVKDYRSYNGANVYYDSENDLEKNDKQLMYTLGQSNSGVGDGKYVNDALLIPQKTVSIHDIKGNEIEVNLIENFEFLCKAYTAIREDSEVRESITDQIGNHEVVIPYKETRIKKYKTCEQVYGETKFYENKVYTGFTQQGEIRATESWRSFSLDLKNYFGVENKYHLQYNWREHFDLIEIAKVEIEKVFASDDMRNLMLKNTMNCDYSDFNDALNDNHKATVVNTFFKNIQKLVPEPDSKNNLDVFFKTRHALNIIGDVHIEKVLKSNGLSADAHDFVYKLREQLKVINKRVKITGHYENFLNEFVIGCEAKVVETPSVIDVSCKANHFIHIKSLVELHSVMELAEVQPEEDGRITMKFITPADIAGISNVEHSRGYATMNKKCPCGCDNYIQKKLIKYNDDDD